MPAPLTIIIPTLNAAEPLPATLSSLFEGVSEGLVAEVIFADGGSIDATEKIADNVGARLVPSRKGRGYQMNTGAMAAHTPWLMFVHADTQFSQGWPATVQHHISHSKKAGYAQLVFDAKGFAPKFVAGWANLRSKMLGLPYGDQTLLISASLYQKIGGYPDQPLMEDVAIARKLKGQMVRLPMSVTTSSERYLKEGWFRRGAKNLGTLVLYFLGRDPEKLATRYHR